MPDNASAFGGVIAAADIANKAVPLTPVKDKKGNIIGLDGTEDQIVAAATDSKDSDIRKAARRFISAGGSIKGFEGPQQLYREISLSINIRREAWVKEFHASAATDWKMYETYLKVLDSSKIEDLVWPIFDEAWRLQQTKQEFLIGYEGFKYPLRPGEYLPSVSIKPFRISGPRSAVAWRNYPGVLLKSALREKLPKFASGKETVKIIPQANAAMAALEGTGPQAVLKSAGDLARNNGNNVTKDIPGQAVQYGIAEGNKEYFAKLLSQNSSVGGLAVALASVRAKAEELDSSYVLKVFVTMYAAIAMDLTVAEERVVLKHLNGESSEDDIVNIILQRVEEAKRSLYFDAVRKSVRNTIQAPFDALKEPFEIAWKAKQVQLQAEREISATVSNQEPKPEYWEKNYKEILKRAKEIWQLQVDRNSTDNPTLRAFLEDTVTLDQAADLLKFGSGKQVLNPHMVLAVFKFSFNYYSNDPNPKFRAGLLNPDIENALYRYLLSPSTFGPTAKTLIAKIPYFKERPHLVDQMIVDVAAFFKKLSEVKKEPVAEIISGSIISEASKSIQTRAADGTKLSLKVSPELAVEVDVLNPVEGASPINTSDLKDAIPAGTKAFQVGAAHSILSVLADGKLRLFWFKNDRMVSAFGEPTENVASINISPNGDALIIHDTQGATTTRDLVKLYIQLRDAAMAGLRDKVVALALPPGGIDLNTSNGMQWKVSKDGKGVEMNVDPAMIERVRREGINSLSPVIFKITPITDIWPLVGLQAPVRV
jgi:hypothetical protein